MKKRKNKVKSKFDFLFKISLEKFATFYSKNKKLVKIFFAGSAIIAIGLGIYFYTNKINSLNKQLLETKVQAATEKKLSSERLAEETSKMKDAQEKANQETIKKNETAKKLAEQQLKEQELNADNDGDGLTYRQEISYGTSDSNTDSDSDGIPDGQDMHPAGGGRNISQIFSWDYGGTDWTFTTAIPEDWYDYYKGKVRLSPTNIAYVTHDNSFIKEIADKVSTKAKENSYCDACFAAAFIQSLPYINDVYTGYDEYPKYPIETLFEKNGDCEDTSYLTAAITSAMNIDTVLVLLPGHMAVAAWASCDTSGTYYKVNDKCYYYIETTGDGFSLGEIPDKYKYSQATLLKVTSGEKFTVNPQYKKPCTASSEYPGYYYGKDDGYYFSDSQCSNIVTCLPYKNFYYAYKSETAYWDSSCTQIIVKGCSRSADFSGYFCTSSDNYCIEYYYDSRCSQKATICRPSSVAYDQYYDGYLNYWDASCTQRVLSWCSKSSYRSGYFLNTIDYKYYYDSQCTQKAGL